MKDSIFKPDAANVGVHAYNLIWSGHFMPTIGDIVQTPQHGLARVVGWFTEDGFLGVETKPLDPPAWFINQCGKNASALFFGAEIKKGKTDA